MNSESSVGNSAFLAGEAAKSIQFKKKPSKKIRKMVRSLYKPEPKATHLSAHRSSQNLINILENRKVPHFLIDLVRKKKILNFSSLTKTTLGKNIQEH